MGKIYVQRYTDNEDLPRAKPPITISAGKRKSIKVPFPSEGYLTKVVVFQTSGTAVNFDVEIVDSEIPFPTGEAAYNAAPADDVDLYRVIPKQTATAGNVISDINLEWGYPFNNQDGTLTDNQRYIYVVIIPNNSPDESTWEFSLTAHTEVP